MTDMIDNYIKHQVKRRSGNWIVKHGVWLVWLSVILAGLIIFVLIKLHNARMFHVKLNKRVQILEVKCKN